MKVSIAASTVPIDTSELRQYENQNVVHYASIKGLIQNLPLQQIGAIFTIQVKQMIELAALAASCGRKPLCIWSPNSNAHPLSLEQQKARAYILEHEELPPSFVSPAPDHSPLAVLPLSQRLSSNGIAP